MQITAYDIARTFVGMAEVDGVLDNPQILAFLRTDMEWPEHDEVPWCSGFANFVCKLLPGVARSRSLLARSWLAVGDPVALEEAEIGFDVVVLKRGGGEQPGPENRSAPGHVGFYAGHDEETVTLLGGNQGDSVSLASYPRARILGIRRLHHDH